MKNFPSPFTALCLGLLCWMAPATAQQGTWAFKEVIRNRTPASVGQALDLQHAVETTDKWFGPVLEFKDPGGRFSMAAGYLDPASDSGNISFWFQTPRAGNDATWQPVLTFNPRGNGREQIIVNLRWNRFIVREGGNWVLDTIEKKKPLQRNQWHHISINFSHESLEVFLDGRTLGRADIEEVDLQLAQGLHFGGEQLIGKISQVNLFSKSLSEQEIRELIQKETPPRPEGWEDPAPNIARFSIGKISDSKGYTIDEIREFFPEVQKWNDYDSSLTPLKKADGYAAERFSPPPAPYEHPRIFFNASDLDAIRKEIAGSYLRKQKWELMRSRCFQMRSTPDAWEAMGKLRTPEKGSHPDNPAWSVIRLPKKGYHGPWVGGWVNDLAKGIEPEALKGKWNQPVNRQTNPRQYLMHLMPYEALRCLIDQDAEGGERIGKALATICKLYGRHMDQWQSTGDWGGVYQLLASDSIGVTYDWAYPFMTEADRTTVRKFISDITKDKTSIGFDHVPAYPGTTSNWATINMHLINLILAIEGEEGFHEDVYQGCVEVMRKWCYVATGPKGAPFEGYNKSSYATQYLLPLAKREADFLSTQWVKNAGSAYHLATMLPWGTEHVYEVESGPNVLPRDFAPFKYAYPADPIIDLVYGNVVKDQFGENPQLEWEGIRTTYAPFYPYLLYYDDPIGSTLEGDYDFRAQAIQVVDALSRTGRSTSYYSDYRGLLTTRSSWKQDAAFLLFEPRNVPGGHTIDARNDFVIASHGRSWTQRPRGGNGEGPSEIRNIILIDGIGQGHQCVQGRTLSLVDNEQATIASGDATWAYSFKSGNVERGIKVEHTPNDSRLTKSGLPWMEKPWSFLPGWREGKMGALRHGYWFEHNPVEYSYRTVALIKNEKPYWIIRDDLKKDDQPHTYTWLFQIPDDLEVVQAARVNDGAIDLVLGDQQNRRLLVRILEMGGGGFATPATAATIGVKNYEYTYQQVYTHQRLEIEVTDTVGHFTVLLFPFLEGEALPQTKIIKDTLYHKTGEKLDVFSLTRNAQGMSRLNWGGR